MDPFIDIKLTTEQIEALEKDRQRTKELYDKAGVRYSTDTQFQHDVDQAVNIVNAMIDGFGGEGISPYGLNLLRLSAAVALLVKEETDEV